MVLFYLSDINTLFHLKTNKIKFHFMRPLTWVMV